MKKAAKILSAAVVGVGAMSALILVWVIPPHGNPPVAQAQDAAGSFVDPQTLAGLSIGQMAQRLEPVVAYGKQAIQDGNYATAAACFDQIAAALPDSCPKMDALLWSGIARSRGGDPQGAKVMYLQMVAVGKELLVEDYTSTKPHVPLEIGSTESFRDLVRRGLVYSLWICRDAGQTDEALAIIQRFRAEEPEYHYLRKILPIEAQLKGLDPAGLKAQEAEAWRLSDQAKAALGKGDAATAYTLADQIISDYPETGGAMLARNLKAGMLWQEHRYDEAIVLYRAIKDRVSEIAPDSDLGRTASWHLAWLEVNDLGTKLIRHGHDTNLTEADWQCAHDLCDVVRAWAPEDVHRAEMTMLRGELYYWREQYVQAIAMFDDVLQFEDKISQKNGKDAVLLKNIVMMARQFAGFAHLKSKDLDGAIQCFTTVVDACKDDPNAFHGKNAIAAGACLGLWQAYSRKADQAGMLSAESLMQDRWPDSSPARYLRFEKAKMAAVK